MILGRRTFREFPPPGVFTTAMNPGGSGFAVLIVPGNCAVKPLAKVLVAPPAPVGTTQPAVATHCITMSGRTIPISIGTPERALTIVPTSQLPRIALATPSSLCFLPSP